MNKKGFTLIELLAVIVVLGILLLIAVPSVTKIINSSKEKAFKIEMQSYISAVKNERLLTENTDGLQTYKFGDIDIDGDNTKSIYGSDYLYGFVFVNSTDGKDDYYIAACDNNGNSIGQIHDNIIIPVLESNISIDKIDTETIETIETTKLDVKFPIEGNEIYSIPESSGKTYIKYEKFDRVIVKLSETLRAELFILDDNKSTIRAMFYTNPDKNSIILKDGVMVKNTVNWTNMFDIINFINEKGNKDLENVSNVSIPSFNDIFSDVKCQTTFIDNSECKPDKPANYTYSSNLISDSNISTDTKKNGVKDDIWISDNSSNSSCKSNGIVVTTGTNVYCPRISDNKIQTRLSSYNSYYRFDPVIEISKDYIVEKIV